MARLYRAAMLMACLLFLSAGSAFAAGGSCNSIPVPSGVTSCFYISASGADTNPGTSESSPWLHAPGMANCASTCASVTPTGGEGFIFRGNDTWHMGNSSAVPYTGIVTNCGFNNTVSAGLCLAGLLGSSGSPIYYGVDLTWFSGGSFARPIFSGDNPLTPHPQVFGDYVASCAYAVGPWNNMIISESSSYVTLDNFELTGLCQPVESGTPASGHWAGHDYYINEGGAANNIYEHLYFHGWTHVQFNCTTVGGNPSGQCFNLRAFNGSNANPGSQYIQIVIDGSDSDPAGLTVMFDGGYNVSQSVFRYTTQTIPGPVHIWHDNLLEYIYGPGDGQAHGNLWEELGEAPGVNAVYNNVFRHVCLAGACPHGLVGIWATPEVGDTEYWFNNLVYDQNTGGNYFDIGANDRNIGTHIIFNNTFEQPVNNTILSCSFAGFTFPFTVVNNHYITNASSPYASSCAGQEMAPPLTELAMTHATATKGGYTISETYAYSPTSSSSPTAGVGTNEQGFCTALSAAGLSDAATACQSDTGYACTYNSSNHTVSCPARTVNTRPPKSAWDRGAYQSGATTASAPNPPQNVTAAVQ